MNIICIIPARGGLKAIPKKNIVDFYGKPLIAWSIAKGGNDVVRELFDILNNVVL